MPGLAPADARLAVSDPALPGLGEVLAPLGLVGRLAPGWGVREARVVYLRYKPGTSLLAALVLTGDDGATSFAQALALRPGAADKLAKVRRGGQGDDVGRGAVVDGSLAVALTDVTADRRLPGVRRVLRDGDGVTPLVYRPGRRWVARVEAPAGPAELVRVYHPGAVSGVPAGHRALAGLPLPAVTAVRPRRGTVRTAWVPGLSLDRLTGTEELWEQAGALAAAVHRRAGVEGLGRVDRAARLARATAAVRSVAPACAGSARDTAERVRAGLAGREAVTAVHGDLSADQVVVRPDLTSGASPEAASPRQAPLTLIDLDRVALDDPLTDLASWYGALVATGAAAGEPAEVLAPLLAGYTRAGGEVDGRALRLHCAAAVLQRAVEPFRRHRADWPDAVARLVSVAAGLAA
ncbi:aminoglycoside phosphotransferase/kinase family protein [Georgenia satyanarayanai]|uniref:hypothetical protein n=1 Tax=Georgenia satyanarayanai TaxID=860221 RepID=UPI00126469FD|nr:hypothetical protein [Georgenia satyanarayanai]